MLRTTYPCAIIASSSALPLASFVLPLDSSICLASGMTPVCKLHRSYVLQATAEIIDNAPEFHWRSTVVVVLPCWSTVYCVTAWGCGPALTSSLASLTSLGAPLLPCAVGVVVSCCCVDTSTTADCFAVFIFFSFLMMPRTALSWLTTWS